MFTSFGIENSSRHSGETTTLLALISLFKLFISCYDPVFQHGAWLVVMVTNYYHYYYCISSWYWFQYRDSFLMLMHWYISLPRFRIYNVSGPATLCLHRNAMSQVVRMTQVAASLIPCHYRGPNLVFNDTRCICFMKIWWHVLYFISFFLNLLLGSSVCEMLTNNGI